MKIKAPFRLEQYRRQNGRKFVRLLSAWGPVYRLTGLLTLARFGRENSWTIFAAKYQRKGE